MGSAVIWGFIGHEIGQDDDRYLLDKILASANVAATHFAVTTPKGAHILKIRFH